MWRMNRASGRTSGRTKDRASGRASGRTSGRASVARRRLAAAALAVAAVTPTFAGCGEDRRAEGADAAVARGIATTIVDLSAMAAGPASATPAELERALARWRSWSGSVAQGDPVAYRAFVDALEAFRAAVASGDQAAMAAASAAFTRAASAYLAEHPG